MGCSSFEAAEDLLTMLVFVSPEILLRSSAQKCAFVEDNDTSGQRSCILRRGNCNMHTTLREYMPPARPESRSPASDPPLLGRGVQAGDADAASFTGDGRMHMAGREGSEMRGSLRALPGEGSAGGSMGLDP